MTLIKIGKIVNTHGIKGELRLLSKFPYKDKVFINNMTIYIDKKDKEIINTYRKHKNFDMITLKGYNNINEVLKYKGKNAYVNDSDIKLDNNKYLDEELIGLNVIYEDNNKGTIVDIERYDKTVLFNIKNRMIKKRYIALLDGKISSKEGTITLPLRMDPLDRPRQVVDHEHGKTAITQYQVLNEQEGNTLIAFYPLTGRTHQLRVHAAHPEGLHCPIRGDELYGQKADRLYLHAESLEFVHPVTKEIIFVEKKSNF